MVTKGNQKRNNKRVKLASGKKWIRGRSNRIRIRNGMTLTYTNVDVKIHTSSEEASCTTGTSERQERWEKKSWLGQRKKGQMTWKQEINYRASSNWTVNLKGKRNPSPALPLQKHLYGTGYFPTSKLFHKCLTKISGTSVVAPTWAHGQGHSSTALRTFPGKKKAVWASQPLNQNQTTVPRGESTAHSHG